MILCPKTHTRTPTNATKHLHCYKINKYNYYDYNKHNLISMSGYRLIAKHCTIVNVNAWQKKNYSTIQKQNSRNILTNRKINNNALVVEVIQMSWAHYMQLSWVVRLCTKMGFFNMSFFIKWAWQFIHHVSKERCAYGSHFRPQINQYANQNYTTLLGNNTTPVFLFGDCMTCHSKLLLAISLLKLSLSLAMS